MDINGYVTFLCCHLFSEYQALRLVPGILFVLAFCSLFAFSYNMFLFCFLLLFLDMFAFDCLYKLLSIFFLPFCLFDMVDKSVDTCILVLC